MHDAWGAWEITVYKTVAAILEAPIVSPWHPPFLYILRASTASTYHSLP